MKNIFQIMRFDTSMESLIGIGRSESFADLMGSSSSLFGNSGETNDNFLDKRKVMTKEDFRRQETLEVVTVSVENRQWKTR